MRRLWLFALLLVGSNGCGQSSTRQPALTIGSGTPTSTTSAADGTAWTWRSDTHGFSVLVPSGQWKLTPNQNVLAKFDCARPLLVASVIGTRPVRSDAEFDAAVAEGKKAKEAGASNVVETSGPNRHGHEHCLFMYDITDKNAPRVFGTSVTRVNGQAVLLMFEAPCRKRLAAERAQEARDLRAQAELFLGSVR